MVPGTYKVYDFGRFIEDFRAYDKNGIELTTEHINASDWKISNAIKLAKITYKVNDTWDADTVNFVFEPSGSNFQKDSNFVLNTHCLFGYFQGKTNFPYQIKIHKPAGFFGASSLTPTSEGNATDIFSTPSYNALVDAPIMYCLPDTTILKIGGAEILFSVYSPNKVVTSKFVSKQIKEVLEAAKNYLGGKLPIEKYAFIIYLFPGLSGSGSAGALEHCYSSMYFLEEGDSVDIAQTIRDVAAHEFYHIITPLNIHSEEIGNFDFSKPKMSRHLWLYEGATEYTAHYVQLREKLKTEKEFMDVIQSKIQTSRKYFNDTLPFTQMSLGCLGDYEKQYQNVYEKGALISFCLDVELRRISLGKMGLQDVINILAKKYPKEKSFKDENLIPEIIGLTYPEIGTFFHKYVEGSTPLPLEEVFADIGYSFKSKETSKDFSFGSLKMLINPKNKRLVVYDTDEMDEFGKMLGFQVGDQLLAINKEKVFADNFRSVKTAWYAGVKEGDKFKVKVLRPTKKGKYAKKTLKAKAIKVVLVRENILEKVSKPSEQQERLLKWWKMGGL
jgi:predicted metalloprotease with PDZ domain